MIKKPVLTCPPGRNRLVGGDGDDTLEGGAGRDLIKGGLGNDTLLGGAGRDVLEGGKGNDQLDGGTGADGLYGGFGDDFLLGGEGNDFLSGGSGIDTAYFNGQRGDFAVRLLANGRIEIRDLLGSEGVDIIAADVEQFSFGGFTYDRQDVLLAPITASETDDTLVGTNASESINGLGGNDWINARAGDDRVLGGDGNDTIFGGDGNDTLLGDAGFDRVSGGAGDDYIIDGEGLDTAIFSGNFADYSVVQQDIHTFVVTDLRAIGDGRDTLINVGSAEFGDGTRSVLELAGGPRTAVGTAGDDYLFGTSGDDRLEGGDGNDFLIGGNGNDVMIGGDGNDTLYATVGSDLISGGSGDDLIHCGGGGLSIISGGAGRDTYQFEQGAGQNVIEDFSVLEDMLDFRGQASYSVVQQDANVLITVGQSTTLLVNVDLGGLTSGNFVL